MGGYLWYLKWILAFAAIGAVLAVPLEVKRLSDAGYAVGVLHVLAIAGGFILGASEAVLEGLVLYKGAQVFIHIINGGETNWKQDALLVVGALLVSVWLFSLAIGPENLFSAIRLGVLALAWYLLEKETQGKNKN